MNFLCRKPRLDASAGAFDLRHRPADTTNTPPRRHDDASISMSSWANIDTEKASRNSYHLGKVDRRRASDSKISYDHRKLHGNSISHEQRKTRPVRPSKVKTPDDASISMSSWANMSVGKICESASAQDRLFQSDSAIRYNGPTDIMIAKKSTSGGAADNLPGPKQSTSGHHSRQTSWGNVDVLGMLSDIDSAREKAAKDILERRDKSERRKNGSKRATVPFAARNTSKSLAGKPPPQRQGMRPPLAGGANRGSTSLRTRTQRV